MRNPARYLYDTEIFFFAPASWYGEAVCIRYPDGRGGYAHFDQETLGL